MESFWILKFIHYRIERWTDDMVEALVLAGTADDVRRQLQAFDGLFDTLLLLSPSFAADPDEVRENNAAMIAAFAQ